MSGIDITCSVCLVFMSQCMNSREKANVEHSRTIPCGACLKRSSWDLALTSSWNCLIGKHLPKFTSKANMFPHKSCFETGSFKTSATSSLLLLRLAIALPTCFLLEVKGNFWIPFLYSNLICVEKTVTLLFS